MLNPEWIGATAEALAAVETGVMVFNKKTDEKTTAASAAPPAVVTGMTGTEFLVGMFLLGLAILGAAMIIHHGLVA